MSTQTSFIENTPPFHPEDFAVQCDLAALCKALARDGSAQFPLEIVTYMKDPNSGDVETTVVHRRVAYAQLLDNGALIIDVMRLPQQP